MTDDGVHSSQLEKRDGARSSALVLPNYGRSSCLLTTAWVRSVREQPTTALGAGHRRKRKSGMVKSVGVDVNPKTAADACERWLSMFDVSVDGDGDVHVHARACTCTCTCGRRRECRCRCGCGCSGEMLVVESLDDGPNLFGQLLGVKSG